MFRFISKLFEGGGIRGVKTCRACFGRGFTPIVLHLSQRVEQCINCDGTGVTCKAA